jgi:hypothetical protein
VALGKRTLEPGESTELEITYKTYKYAGQFDKKVTVFTGSEGKDETIIRLVGNVEPIPMGVLKMEPRKTDVGALSVKLENEVQILLRNTGNAPLAISRIVSTRSDTVYFDGKDSKAIVIPAGDKRSVKLIVKPGEPGRFLDTILIYSDDARNDIGKGYKALLAGEAK